MTDVESSATTDDATRLPPQPKSVRETGLEQALLVELVAKAMFTTGRIHLPVLTGKLRLSINVLREVLGFMLAEQLVEVASRGDSDLDVNYQLTGNGKLRAAEFLARCRYTGPAPVTLQAYRDMVQRQAARHAAQPRVSSAGLAAAFGEDILEPAVRDMIGAALQSSRSLLLHGPSGSGKSTLARKLGQLLPGAIGVPHAILVDHDIVLVYDPLLHLPPQLPQRQGEDRRSVDARWALCQRPQIRVGAELSAAMLDLRYDDTGGVYYAPPHLMANNGMLLIDDLGRQRLATADLMNRFSAPLDGGADQLTLEGGHKVGVPFDVTLVLATNLPPHSLLDESLMRRIGYKIPVGALSESNYRSLFKRQCRLTRVAFDECAFDYLITCLHPSHGRALLASYPRELLSRIADFASFAGAQARLSVPALDQAWSSMFAGCISGAAAPSQPSFTPLAVCGDPLLERIS
ncbi:ATP-binding protein [Massilia sp. PAMC28688]|uniref:ATP-binding protein n=1 Tax=Massilia sp. PAMC28688 TaxID=2861283 RepID=UPI001C6256CF|nr:ATP-binding protein [Massilia sp. PAMC28688]QYF95034.1 ATP-binding protein [Massilia sp. PAMC28688]